MPHAHDIVISTNDAYALQAMLARRSRNAQAANRTMRDLADLLRVARVVSPAALPPTRVTLGASVTYAAHPRGPSRVVTLECSLQTTAGSGRVSVASPVGLAMLGRSVGALTEVMLQSGQHIVIRIIDTSTMSTEDTEALALA